MNPSARFKDLFWLSNETNLITVADDRNGLCDADAKEGGEDVILGRVASLQVLEAVEHPAEVGLLVEEVGEEEDGSDGLREEGQGQVAAGQPLGVELEQKVKAGSESG